MTLDHPPTLLRIDASPRSTGSYSRRIADAAQAAWQRAHPQGSVVCRDLARETVPHIDSMTIAGYSTAPSAMTPELQQATALSDTLIAELQGAHTVLIASPIYNFSVPSSLKAWIDHIVRIGHTFAYEDGQFRGLVRAPRAVLALAYGTAGYQGAMAHMDHLRPYLSAVLHFVGIADVRAVSVEATTADTASTQAALDLALAQAHRLFDAAPQALAV